MKRLAAIVTICFVVSGYALSLADESDSMDHRVSVNEIMVSAITPATNTLWGVDDPQTFEAWKELEDAAIVVIAAGTLVKDGGAGPNDSSWAADPAWQAFAETMIDAAAVALGAARAKDLDALVTATEVMYPPCEECHMQFHPGMQ